MTDTANTEGLTKLRAKFTEHQISKLPKPTKAQTDAVRADFKAGIRCKACGSWHHPDVVHLDYVGHAALTDRLLDTDPNYTCTPMARDETGLPAFDKTGGLWVELTVMGVTRMGYGHAAVKPNQGPGDREKEIIGDAMRNAAMRFGCALDLWHKGDLRQTGDDDVSDGPKSDTPALIDDAQYASLITLLQTSGADSAGFLAHYQIASVDKLPAAAYAQAVKALEKKLASKSGGSFDEHKFHDGDK